MSAGEPPFPPPSGTVLADKYTVVRVIGRGGMAHVLEARHEALDTNVAVKILHPDFRLEEEATSRFQREARAVAKLTSTHVARVLDVDSQDGCPFMVLELLKGLDLGQELTRRGPLPVHEAVTWVIQASEGMRDAHRVGVVHRDLKPSNLFLAETPAGRSLKILDFGISKIVSSDPLSRMTTTQSAFGTPLYMSPEQVRSVKHVDARTDIWSLGVILYEALTCRTPFEQASASALFVSISIDAPRPIEQHRQGLPRGLVAVILKALQKDPVDRYPDVAAFAAALAPYATTDGALALTSPGEAPGGGTAPRQSRRRMALVVAACVVAGVASLITAGLVGKRASDASETTPIEAEQAAITTSQATPPPFAAEPALPPRSGEPESTSASAAPEASNAPVRKTAGARSAAPRPSAAPSTSVRGAPPAPTSAPEPPPPEPENPKYL